PVWPCPISGVTPLIWASFAGRLAPSAVPFIEVRSTLAAILVPVCAEPGVKPVQPVLVPLTLSGGGELTEANRFGSDTTTALSVVPAVLPALMFWTATAPVAVPSAVPSASTGG